MKSLEDILRESVVQGQPRKHRAWKKILIIVEGVYRWVSDVARASSSRINEKTLRLDGFFNVTNRQAYINFLIYRDLSTAHVSPSNDSSYIANTTHHVTGHICPDFLRTSVIWVQLPCKSNQTLCVTLWMCDISARNCITRPFPNNPWQSYMILNLSAN